MEIAVVGADAPALCRIADVGARAFLSLALVMNRDWDLLALTQNAAAEPPEGPLRAKNLLMPGDGDPALAHRAHALQLVGYGFSPRNTLTLSSLAGAERLLCLQRSLLTPLGVLLEPQELPLPASLAALSDEDALLVGGLWLLCGAL